MTKKVSIFIVDDHPVFRDGLRKLLDGKQGISIAGEAGNGIELIDLLKLNTDLPDIIIIDIEMPKMGGFEAIKIIKEKWQTIKIIVLSFHCDEYHVCTSFKLKADAYLPKERSAQEIFETIEELRSNTYNPGENISKIISNGAQTPTLSICERKELKETEIKVLVLIALGNREKEISKILHMALSTVEKYKKQLREKTGLKCDATLALYAVKYGYITI